MTARTLGQNKKNLAIQFAVGALVGGLGGYLANRHWPGGEAPGQHELGLLVGFLLLALGFAIGVASFTRAGAAQLFGAELREGEDVGREMKSARWQGMVTLLAGAELIVLSLGADLLTGPQSTALLALLAATLAAQTWFNVELWRRGDELFRRIIVEASVIAFLIFQFALFFWVVAARFEFASDPSALDIYVMLMVVYLLGSAVASVRRGYGIS